MGKKTKHVKESDRKKDWFRRKTINRPLQERTIMNTFLIYCEGENTEPKYFESFPVTTETNVRAIGLGSSKTALIEQVIRLIRQEDDDPERQVWAVFDRDVKYEDKNKGDEDFNNAIKLATNHNIKCAYSNDCFELWFILHYEYLEAALHRTQFYEKLSSKLNCNYEKEGKNQEFSKSLYSLFLADIDIAIRNARRLHQSHEGRAYCHQNPCTTVYLLVEELNKNLKR